MQDGRTQIRDNFTLYFKDKMDIILIRLSQTFDSFLLAILFLAITAVFVVSLHLHYTTYTTTNFDYNFVSRSWKFSEYELEWVVHINQECITEKMLTLLQSSIHQQFGDIYYLLHSCRTVQDIQSIEHVRQISSNLQELSCTVPTFNCSVRPN